jgi:hypothetical protein
MELEAYMKVIHVMADGTVRESLKGVVIPYNEQTEGFYRNLVNRILEVSKKEGGR